MNETHPSIDRIVDYLHGELSAAEDAAMHAHLAGCSACEELRAEEVAITETLRAHALATERELPPGLTARIRAAVAGAPPASLWERMRTALRPALMLPAAAAIAIVLYFGFATRHGAPPPTAIDPSFYVQNHAVMAGNAPFSQDGAPVELTSSNETP